MQKLLKIVFSAPVAFVILTLATSLLERQSLAQTASPHVKSVHQGALAEPLLTGTDGSQTGVAKFQGNFTTITAPSGQALALSRASNCSLLLLTGTFTSGQPFSYTSTSITPNYERVLHSEAGLTTTADSVTLGCIDPSRGLGSRPGAFVGKTTTGVNVYAAVYYNFMTGSNALYILTGTTTFSLNIFSFSMAGTITAADLNGDGNNDLVVVNNGATISGQIFVMLGNTDGSFQTAVPYATAGAASVAAVIDDFNNDGKLDIAASSNNGMISVLTGKGDGSFNSAQSFAAPAPTYLGSTLTASSSLTNLISADLRSIGKKDIIASNGTVLLGNGDGTFTAAASAAFPPLTATSSVGPNLAAGDINSDGKLDLVVGTGSNVLTYIGNGAGTFSPGNSYASVNTDGFVTVTDLDGDGSPDIYVGDANNGLFRGDQSDTNIAYALMGNGDGTFRGAPATLGGYIGTNLADVNGDGQPDLITANLGAFNSLGNTFTVQLGTAKGAFTPVSTITLPASITVSVSEFTSPITINTANLSVSSYAVGDLNGDGKADLAFVSNSGGYAVYFVALSNGDGTFSTPVAYGFPQIAPSNGFDITTTINSLQIGDFNHDGKADLIFNFNDVAGPFGNGLYLQGLGVLPGNGDGTFKSPVLTSTYNSTTTPPNGGIPSIASIQDLNGDGTPDLIAFNSTFAVVNGVGVTTSTVQVYLDKGDGTFAAPTTAITSAHLASLAVADFNKDGKLDIAVLSETSTSQAQLNISLGNGDGTFATPTVLNASGGDAIRSSSIAAADFDSDGNVDLALLDANSMSGVYYGKGDGTFTSVPFNGNSLPKDLINLYVGGAVVAVDLNKDGKPDLLVGNTILLNLYGAAITPPTLFDTTTGLTASASSITTGGSITFTATITPAAGSTGTPSDTVTFLDSTTTLGTGTLAAGKATYTTTSLTSGSHSITAVYGGDTAFSGSTSSVITITVTAPPALISTTTTLTASPATGVSGTSITVTALVTPASGTAIPTGTVTFSDGSTSIGSASLDATGKAAISTTILAVGSHGITAAYAGATAFSGSTSSSVTVTVTAPAPDFSLSISPGSGTETKSTSATATLTVMPINGFNAAVTLGCSGLPSGVSCSFSPGTLTPAGSPASTTVTFSGSASAMAQPGPGYRRAPVIVLACSFGAWLLVRRRRYLLTGLLMVLFTASLFSVGGCGSSSPPAKTSTVTLNATSGAISHSTTYSLTTQ